MWSVEQIHYLIFVAMWAFAWILWGTCVATSITEDLDRKRVRKQARAIQWHDYKGNTAMTNQTMNNVATWTNSSSHGIYFNTATSFDVYGNTFTWDAGGKKTDS